MLQLQRASAGSGKTYLLAKKFIEYFISAREDNGKRRLRHPRELRESLSGILAITFTNKATNEMKLRIVDKLDSLANWTPPIPVSSVDYLNDFSNEFDCSPQEIASLCRHALKVLLTDYGDFKVSTIDSFFQTVLRTFAYEAGLDDTYQLELDSNYVSQMGLDTTLDEIDATGNSSQGTFWIKSMMEEKVSSGKGWNIFQKNANRHSVYGQILNASRNLGKEDFKEIRDDLDKYFENNPDFFHTFHQLRKIYETGVRNAFDAMRKAAKDLNKAFLKIGLDIDEYGGKYLGARVHKMAETWEWDFADEKETKFKIPEFTRKGTTTRVFDPKKTDNPYLGTDTEDRLEILAINMYSLYENWLSEVKSEKMRKWSIYRATMPYVGLLQSVRGNSRLFLTDSNTVELGETNSILQRIIGDDDAPFVYERLGSRLDHFLIDEFQDTSRMQWTNLKPLLSESEGKGNDNLIIGDAKQSIYRFRNADPSLISEKVPQQFASTCKICGTTPAANTNWRSSRRIVEFNNLFFRFLTSELGDDMEKLYSNTVQPPHHNPDYGYVSIQLFKKDNDEEIPAHFDRIPEMIADMLKRGYAKKDIAILVDTREQGAQIIDRIMAYNRSNPIENRIDFISADSLKVGESTAVQTVISVLTAINNSAGNFNSNKKEEGKSINATEWSRIKADFSFYALRHPDSSLSELLTQFLQGDHDPDAIRGMLHEMSTTVLPAIVENTIQHFIPANMRDSEAPFLAALQDQVLDFCEGRVSDIASFLQWWDKKGKSMSISSPEDADAVQVMTVHKSKGLEFRCVIVPYSKQTTQPHPSQDKEWLWVKPDLSEAQGIGQIPWIPVWSDRKLLDTPHSATYLRYLNQYLADKVNMAYVAYTRAVDELYIFTPIRLTKEGTPASGTGRIGEYLWRCGVESGEIIENLSSTYPAIRPYIPDPDMFSIDTDSLKWTFGTLPGREEVLAMTVSRAKKSSGHSGIPIKGYRCGVSLPALVYSDPTDPEQSLLPEPPEEGTRKESEESRRYGELMHAIMENIDTPTDLDIALLRMRVHGYIDSNQMKQLKTELSEAMSEVASFGWFDNGLTVIKERGIAIGGRILRPDRIVLRPDGTAVVIDYKFGEVRDDKAYLRQVKRYANAIVKSGLVKDCKAYVWYVSLGSVIS